MERGLRKKKLGRVISDKMDKTIVVAVETKVRHPLYGKTVPTLAILDETDSGLDVDALRIVANGVNALHTPEKAAIVITHYQRLLDYIVPDVVHVLKDGKIVKTAGKELVAEIEEKGYDNL